MAKTPEVRIYSDTEKVIKAIAQEFIAITKNSQQPRFDVALSGGKTPRLLFKKLAETSNTEVNWNRIHFWWGDERCVPPESDESNFKLAFDHFFSKISIPAENIHRINGENNPEKEAERYSHEIKQNLNFRGEWPVFDLIILGLGDDGHTASIFPDQLELVDEPRICVHTVHPLSGRGRITLTGKVLNNASRIFFLVTGESKSMRISEIMNNNEAAKLLPAYYILPANGSLIWFLDEDAARLIT